MQVHQNKIVPDAAAGRRAEVRLEEQRPDIKGLRRRSLP